MQGSRLVAIQKEESLDVVCGALCERSRSCSHPIVQQANGATEHEQSTKLLNLGAHNLHRLLVGSAVEKLWRTVAQCAFKPALNEWLQTMFAALKS